MATLAAALCVWLSAPQPDTTRSKGKPAIGSTVSTAGLVTPIVWRADVVRAIAAPVGASWLAVRAGWLGAPAGSGPAG